MRFPPSFLDEIRTRVPVSSVVARRVQLKKAGREWRGLSPFNAEKTPSFFVNDQKMAWFDFSSGKNGNVFDFLMETEGLTFPEAVERLAAEAGLPLPEVTPETMRREEARRTLVEVMDLAARFFEETLQSRLGAHARGYLSDRDIRPETQRTFRIGYAPDDRFALRDHLAQKGVSKEDMIATGLLVHGDDIAVPYDRFRNRVMFPIQDLRGAVVAFGGRALEKDVPAKYLNSPETELFHKGSIVYNGHRARKAAHDAGRILVVEGYVDVVALAQAGIMEAVAPLGTALTENQLDLVWRMESEPTLCFDGDKAGVRAAHRAIDVALPKLSATRTLRFAFLPTGMDPDDLVRKRGREAMEEVLRASRPLVDVLWERETATGLFDTPERRAALEARVRALTRSIADQSLQRWYEEDLRRRLRALTRPPGSEFGSERPFERRGGGMRGGTGKGARQPIQASESLRHSALAKGRLNAWGQRDALLVAVPIIHPGLMDAHGETFAQMEIDDPDLDALRGGALAAFAFDEAREADGLADALRRRGLGDLVARLLTYCGRQNLFFLSAKAATEDAVVTWLQMATLHHKARTLHRELKLAESAFADDPTEDNDARLRAIRRELLATEGTEALIDGYGVMSGRAPRAG